MIARGEGVRRRQILAVLPYFLGFTAAQGGVAMAGLFGPPATLTEMEARVDQNFQTVSHMRFDDLSRRLAAGEDLVLVDVREAPEYAVSHLAGAVRLDPSASAADAAWAIGPAGKGKTIVFYCSVGQRSSVIARRAGAVLVAAGARSVVNLRGGIFRWRNQGLPVVNAQGSTPFVHPFDRTWGKLLTRQDLIAFAPQRQGPVHD
jgi:rhodanese-related sulfurtransferase